MKHPIKTWLSLFVAMVFVGSSCNLLDDNYPDELDPESTDQSVAESDTSAMVAVQVSMQNDVATELTRADNVDDVEGYDYYINPYQFNCLFYNGNANSDQSQFISRMGAVYKVEDDGNNQYTIYGRASSIPKTGYKWVAVANHPDLFVSSHNYTPYVTTLHQLMFEDGVFDWPAGATPTAQRPIPMFAICGTSGTFPAANNGVHLLSTKISLLRALTRIVVRSNDDLADVRITRCNIRGFALPRNYYYQSPGIYSLSENEMMDADMNIPGECDGADIEQVVAEDVAFTNLGKDKLYKYNYILYMPEYRNTTHRKSNKFGYAAKDPDASTIVPAKLSFTLMDDPFEIAIGDYDSNGAYIEGTQTNLVRNHTYEFILTYKSGLPVVKYSVLSMDTLTAGDIVFE